MTSYFESCLKPIREQKIVDPRLEVRERKLQGLKNSAISPAHVRTLAGMANEFVKDHKVWLKSKPPQLRIITERILVRSERESIRQHRPPQSNQGLQVLNQP